MLKSFVRILIIFLPKTADDITGHVKRTKYDDESVYLVSYNNGKEVKEIEKNIGDLTRQYFFRDVTGAKNQRDFMNKKDWILSRVEFFFHLLIRSI